MQNTGESLELKPWKVELKPGGDVHFKKFDKAAQQMIMKKLDKMEEPLQARRLHASHYQVEEVGQYRIAFEIQENVRTKSVHFIGTHKQYEKWYKEQA